ncbi:rab-GTPase-TBC domain-containing protein [Gongronella butleri]|nr:rab-GTPase-TBC domain-containing protein [Gongronella butleri]
MDALRIKKEAWDATFNDAQLSLTSIRQRGLVGTVCETGLRSVCWKIYLHCLPSLDFDTWQAVPQEERLRYHALRRKYIEEPAELMRNKTDDVADNNPLALSESNPWQQYFADAEIRKVIRQDVDRTFPDVDFFRSQLVQERMTDILFIYCKIHEDVSYRQGMHELLAPFYWVVAADSLEDTSEAAAHELQLDPSYRLMAQILDPNYVEHDAYLLFEKLMTYAKPWYELNAQDAINRSRSASDLSATPKSRANPNPIVNVCQRIQNQYLRVVDQHLYRHLTSFGIEPQLYGIRWLRLLFGREFDFSNLLKLWDAIFAQDPTLQIVDYVCVAILLRLHDQLMAGDYAECLSVLMRGPRISKPKTLVEQAKYLQQHMNADGGLQILRQNDIRLGKEPRSVAGGDANAESGVQNRSSNAGQIPVSPPLDSFSSLTRGVMNSAQVRDLNKAIAGVMGTVQKNVNIIGDNMRQALQEDHVQRRRRTDVSDVQPQFTSTRQFASSQQRKPPQPWSSTQPRTTDALSYAKVQATHLQMGNVMAKCIDIFEKQMFAQQDSDNAFSTTTMSNPLASGEDDAMIKSKNNVDEASLVLALAGLKHIRDVLLEKQPNFDKDILKVDHHQHDDDDWALVNRVTDIAKKPLPAIHRHQQTSGVPNSSVSANAASDELRTSAAHRDSVSSVAPIASSMTPPATNPPGSSSAASYTIEDLLSDPTLQTKGSNSQNTSKFAWMLDDDSNQGGASIRNQDEKQEIGLAADTVEPAAAVPLFQTTASVARHDNNERGDAAQRPAQFRRRSGSAKSNAHVTNSASSAAAKSIDMTIDPLCAVDEKDF